jgi:hypothetical protein
MTNSTPTVKNPTETMTIGAPIIDNPTERLTMQAYIVNNPTEKLTMQRYIGIAPTGWKRDQKRLKQVYRTLLPHGHSDSASKFHKTSDASKL